MRIVEVLYFDGCPGIEAALAAVEIVVGPRTDEVDVRKVEVTNDAAAKELRFLGSPSIRVDGVDVEPGSGERRDFGVQCRVYSVNGRLQNTPAREWIERALASVGQR